MQAVVFHAPKVVEVEERPEPGIHVHAGQALVHDYVDELMEMVRSGALLADDIITHRLPLRDAPHAYSMFNRKEDDCVKVVLDPWS